MDTSLTEEPVSSATPAFGRLVDAHLASAEAIVVLLRYSHCGGAKAYFLVRQRQQLDKLLASVRAKTSITVFFESGLLKGNVSDALRNSAIALFRSVKEKYGGIDVIRQDGGASELDQEHLIWLAEEEEITAWFAANPRLPVLVGVLRFWEDNNLNVVTVYVPDADGVVRPGAY